VHQISLAQTRPDSYGSGLLLTGRIAVDAIRIVCYAWRMTRPETLSVRLSVEARRTLDEAAIERNADGASALAREILESWVAERQASQTRAGVQRAISYLRAHGGNWSDDPGDFFPDAAET